MTEPLYLRDHYLKEFEANVIKVDNKSIILDKTAFYPQGGGQPSDFGIIKRGNEEFKVVFVKKTSEGISHELNKEGLKKGERVLGIIDWQRRYSLMKAHTAAHIISEVIHKETQAFITGNQLDENKVRIDFSLEDFNKEKMQDYVNKANEIIKQNLPIGIDFKTREEAFKIPQISKLAMGLPESIKEVRLVSIGNFDLQADAGTHVRSTKEIGKLEFIKAENKGKNNRRLYIQVKDG